MVKFTGAQIAASVRSNRVRLRSFETPGSCYHFSSVTSRKNRMVWHVAVKTRRNYFEFRRQPVSISFRSSSSRNDTYVHLSLWSRFRYRACRSVAACHGCGLLHNGTSDYRNIDRSIIDARPCHGSKRSVAGHSLPRIGFDASLVHVAFVVDTVALWQVSVPIRTQNTSVLKTLGFVEKRNSYLAYLYFVKRRCQ